MCICEKTPHTHTHTPFKSPPPPPPPIRIASCFIKKKVVLTKTRIKMNGYSRIKSLHTIESSDFLSSPQTKHKTHEPPSEMEENGDASTDKKRSAFGAPKFHRNSSVSSSTSMQVSAVKRAFSMRRSSSVSERYCRIHDQHAVLASTPDDEEFERGMDSHNFGSFDKEKKCGNGGKRILKSCKRIFGL